MRNPSDILIGAALALATAVCVWTMAPFGFHAGFVDMGHDGYQLRQALDLWHGGTLFKDTFDQYGPLSPQLNQIGFALFGHRLLGIKQFLAIWYGATAVLLYFLSRRFLDRTLSAVTILLWLLLAPFYQHGVMISPHAYAVGFQVAALILMLQDEEAQAPSRLWMIGVLAGISALLKQSLGVLFVGSLIAYVASSVLTGDATTKAAFKRILRLAGGFAIVLGVGLGWLFWRGAIHDWYLQTVVFPRSFYVAGTGPDKPGLAMAFITAQGAAEPIWLILRFIIIGGGIAAVIAGRSQRKLLLAALVMLGLWFAAFPSANYMHQWWTIGPAICAAVYSLHWLSASLLARVGWRAPALATSLTIALVAIIGRSPITARLNDAAFRFLSLTTTIVEPAVLGGIHSDPDTAEVIAGMYRSIAVYRREHPGSPVISIDASDGYTSGIAQSLITLSFIQEPRHPHPVYWNLPVLSTTAYPEYAAQMSKFIGDERPLIVDFRSGLRPMRSVRGYRLRRSALLGDGRLYLYEPLPDAESAAPASPLLEASLDGRELVVAPNPHQLPPESSEASPAGSALSPEIAEPPVILARSFKDEVDGALRLVRVETWPSRLDVPERLPDVVPDPGNLVAMKDRILTGSGGTWIADGRVGDPQTYLLQYQPKRRERGAAFVVVGDLQLGGLTVGLLRHDRWVGYINVTTPGWFGAVVQVPEAGDYAAVVASYVPSEQLGLLGRLSPAWLRTHLNQFRIASAGWAIFDEPNPRMTAK